MCRTCSIGLAFLVWLANVQAFAQEVDAPDQPKRGYLIDVPLPLTASQADRVLQQLTQVHLDAPEGQRVTVVMRYSSEDGSASAGNETKFEDALKLARAMSGPDLRRVRAVSWVMREVTGHSTLPIIASDLLLVSPEGVIANASENESGGDKTIALTYEAIAE
ncbi:MAG: nodulation protein NfeD, partial [Planctomycetota bacterium]